MSCKCGTQNQTHPDSIKALAAAKKAGTATTGTGVFIVPAPDKGIMEFTIIIIEDIEYDECVKIGIY